MSSEVCRHCGEAIEEGATGGWVDEYGSKWCNDRDMHEPTISKTETVEQSVFKGHEQVENVNEEEEPEQNAIAETEWVGSTKVFATAAPEPEQAEEKLRELFKQMMPEEDAKRLTEDKPTAAEEQQQRRTEIIRTVRDVLDHWLVDMEGEK